MQRLRRTYSTGNNSAGEEHGCFTPLRPSEVFTNHPKLNCKQRPGLGFPHHRSVLWAAMGHLPSARHWALRRTGKSGLCPQELSSVGQGVSGRHLQGLRDEKETPHQKQKEASSGPINKACKSLWSPADRPFPTWSPRPADARPGYASRPHARLTSRSWAGRVPGPLGPPVPGTRKVRGTEWAQRFHFYLRLDI